MPNSGDSHTPPGIPGVRGCTCRYYCPGTFTESVKVRVDLGRYTTPDLPDRLTTRAGQQWCEQNYYCVDGRRKTCGDDTCWPYPKRVVVAESLDPGLRAPGMSDGDRIIITFSTETNQPVNVTHPNLVSQLVQYASAVLCCAMACRGC